MFLRALLRRTAPAAVKGFSTTTATAVKHSSTVANPYKSFQDFDNFKINFYLQLNRLQNAIKVGAGFKSNHLIEKTKLAELTTQVYSAANAEEFNKLLDENTKRLLIEAWNLQLTPSKMEYATLKSMEYNFTEIKPAIHSRVETYGAARIATLFTQTPAKTAATACKETKEIVIKLQDKILEYRNGNYEDINPAVDLELRMISRELSLCTKWQDIAKICEQNPGFISLLKKEMDVDLKDGMLTQQRMEKALKIKTNTDSPAVIPRISMT